MMSPDTHVLSLSARAAGLLSFRRLRTPLLVSCLAQPYGEGPAPASVRQAVSLLAGRANLPRGSRIYLLAATHETFSRLVTLPRLSQEKLAQLIQFEASEQIPSSLERVAWGYALYPGRSREETDILLSAVKFEHLAPAEEALHEAGLTLAGVLSPHLALEALARSFAPGPRCDLFIEIGETQSTLLFLEGPRTWPRAIPFGVDGLVHALAEKLNVRAEDAQAALGRLSLWPTVEDPQASAPDRERIQQVVREFFNGFVREVAHTEQFFISSAGGRVPERLFLAGEGAVLRGLAPYLEAEFERPVAALDVRRAVELAPPALDALRAGAAPFTLAVAAALELSGKRFRPAHALRSSTDHARLALEAKRRDVVYLLITSFIVLFVFFLSVGQSVSMKQSARRDLEHRAVAYRESQKAIGKLLTQLRPVHAETKRFSEHLHEKAQWPLAMRELARLTPPNMWMNRMAYTRETGVLTLEGETLANLVAMNDFLKALEASSVFETARVISADIQVTSEEDLRAATDAVPGFKTTRVFTCELTFERPASDAEGSS